MQYIKLINYLTSLGHGHPSIDTVVHGDYEEIFAIEKHVASGVMYWIETPDINPTGDADNLEQDFQCAIIISIPTKPGDLSKNILNKDLSHAYLMRVIKKLIQDQEEGKISDVAISRINIEPIQISADNRIGWRAEIPINQPVCEEVGDYPDIIHPSFSLIDGDIIEDVNDTLSSYDHQWNMYIDGKKTTTMDAPELDTIAEDSTVYIELIYTGKNHHIAASMTLTDNTDAESVPYTNNPFI